MFLKCELPAVGDTSSRRKANATGGGFMERDMDEKTALSRSRKNILSESQNHEKRNFQVLQIGNHFTNPSLWLHALINHDFRES